MGTSSKPAKGRTMRGRIGVAVCAALVAFVAATALAGGSDRAFAVQGQAILAGNGDNTETSATLVRHTYYRTPEQCDPAGDYNTAGLIGCGLEGLTGIGSTGVRGVGDSIGVTGVGDTFGVTGDSFYGIGVQGFTHGGTGVEGYNVVDGGTGVHGFNGASTGIGVHGETYGTGSAVYGEAVEDGVGVFGDTVDGTGLEGRSTSGMALRVLGMAEFSRSGLATVVAGKTSKKVTGVSLSSKSMVIATIQGKSAGVWILGVQTNILGFSFTISLNKAPTANLNVGWFIIERP